MRRHDKVPENNEHSCINVQSIWTDGWDGQEILDPHLKILGLFRCVLGHSAVYLNVVQRLKGDENLMERMKRMKEEGNHNISE